jgi:hypothetical protein
MKETILKLYEERPTSYTNEHRTLFSDFLTALNK